ncbi:hypothetical protein BU24DRAFT_451083 [Aaosphaeria arxii CBS 175.79]|uniref:TFIIS N-terminal domain-containing protein n=1 Tax=Aaosphaeria arxii CBS 175.79 TaxID=1450172 RepID=A0A6A5XTC4_9PLEO|nr:uncharacterized protein BU24DRAFT_451083 [Aaosphaeria arxii CBS 175.79]KAF2016585.1 hypothetical protein BU24DRAFT_451083 [Aaosphaeria arxii CBS 175.79]
MEDAKFVSDHDNDQLPEAGNDPDDPLRPEIDEENSTPNPPIGDPDQDMEVTEKEPGMPDQEDVEEAGLSDNESELSSVADEDRLAEFDVGDIAIEERAPQMIDDTNVGLIGVHKRKRAEGEAEPVKKKKRRADKPRRKKNRDEDPGAPDDAGSRKSKRSKKAERIRGASPEEEPEENLTPEERRRRALERAMDEATKGSSSRRRKKGDIDLEQMADQEIEEMRKRMSAAAEADNEGRQRGEPARHKLKLLPEVVTILNKSTLKENIVDPETNLLEAVRFFLEPLSDGSLPAYNIQKELFAALGKLPVNKDTLVASGIGKVIMFYIKSKRPELGIKRQAERLFTDWTRPILRRTDDYRKKEFQQADYDPTRLPVRNSQPGGSQAAAAAARAKALEAPRVFQRARMEAGPTTYTVVPKSNVIYNDQANKRSGGAGEDILRRIRSRGGRGGR